VREFTAVFLLLAVALPATARSAHSSTPTCRGSSVRGSFRVVLGSGSLGHIVYRLGIVNRSGATCAIPRRPKLTLLGKNSAILPTHATFPASSASTIAIPAGRGAVADALFSPDVPSRGEHQRGLCEHRAFLMRVGFTHDNGVLVRVRPPTSVCGYGRMTFRRFHLGRR
jgi:uncharacterized protein DUF4232